MFVDRAAEMKVAFDLRVCRSSACFARFERDERERAWGRYASMPRSD
jgi:hypothetical protein